MIVGAGFFSQVNGSIVEEIGGDGEAFGPEPYGAGEEKGHDGGVAEEVQFIGFPTSDGDAVCFGLGGFVEDGFGDDVLCHEEDGASQGVD